MKIIKKLKKEFDEEFKNKENDCNKKEKFCKNKIEKKIQNLKKKNDFGKKYSKSTSNEKNFLKKTKFKKSFNLNINKNSICEKKIVDKKINRKNFKNNEEKSNKKFLFNTLKYPNFSTIAKKSKNSSLESKVKKIKKNIFSKNYLTL